MNNLLETLREENFAIIEQARKGVKRDFAFPKAENMIKVAIGMRRSGKTYFLYQNINELLDHGVLQEQILFINFEDDRLLPIDAKKMGELLDSFYSLYPENHNRCCYIFLDEIQNVENWNLVVRRYFDSKNVQLYLTGSSAKLLSKEINTNLRGRSLAVEIFPFSLQEYLCAHDLCDVLRSKRTFGQGTFDVLRQQLTNYFAAGGFPAVQFMLQKEWRETLQNYVDTVILRDIVERHNVTNIVLLKYLVLTLIKNAAAPFSVNKFYNDITSQGYRVSKETIHNYLEYIEDAFLIFTVPCYSSSMRTKQNRPKKIYAIDNGLINAATLNFSRNYGKLFENLVYLDLRRQKKKIYFYNTSDGFEIDFLTEDPEGKRELIQVSWDTEDKKVFEREQRALTQAEQELGITGKIITAREYLKQKGQV